MTVRLRTVSVLVVVALVLVGTSLAVVGVYSAKQLAGLMSGQMFMDSEMENMIT